MRGLRLTKAERALLGTLLEGVEAESKLGKIAASIRAKLAAIQAPMAPGVAAQPFEMALIDSARGKVVSVDPKAYGRVSNMATACGATVDGARVMGDWLARQAWLHGPLTVFTVLTKWHDWMARAKATAAPDGAPEGINADVGQSAAAKRPATTSGRRAPGLG